MTMIPDLRPPSRPVSIPLLLGLFVGSLSIGRQGIYFALVTLAFGWAMSGEVVLMALRHAHGVRSHRGAAIVVTIQNYFASFGAWVTVLQGATFVIAVLLFRERIVRVLARWLKSRSRTFRTRQALPS